MDKNNTLIIILHELQELQRRYLFENQSYRFKIEVVNINIYKEAQIIVEFCPSMRSSLFVYEVFESFYQEELLLETLEHLKRKIDEAINMLHNALHD